MGLPQTQVLLWVSSEQLRGVFEHVLLAEVVYRARRPSRRASRLLSMQQVLLFEVIPIGSGRVQSALV